MKAIWMQSKTKQHSGTLSVDKGELDFFDDTERRIYACERVQIKFIGPHGMMLTGFEPVGVDKSGRRKYRYVEPYSRWKD